MHSQAVSFDLATRTWDQPALPALDSPRTLVLAFGAPELIDDPRVFAELARAYPRSLIVGCSSAGEIHGTAVRDHSLAVSVTRFDKTELQLAALEVQAAADSFSTGSQLAGKLAARPGLRGVLVLSEGLSVNGSELIRGLNSVLPDSVVVTGGLSGDGANFKRTWVAVGAKLRSNLVAAVGFYGDHVVIGHGSKGGWDKFGPERVITKAEGNVLYELDGRPALTLYKEYLGDKAKDLPASGLLFPLAIRAPRGAGSPAAPGSGDDKLIVRTLLAVDHQRNSLTFAGDLPVGHTAQLMKADFDRLIDGAGVAGQMTAATGKPPADADALVVAISCVGRRLVLGARVEEEVEAVRDAVPPRAHITGFYSYGEISPYATGHCDLHNQTMTLTVFSESPTPIARPATAAPRTSQVLEAVSAPIAVPASRPAIATAPIAAPVATAVTSPTRTAPVTVPPLATAAPAAPPTGPIVRVPRPVGADAVVDVTTAGDLQIVRIRGRITEAFKGEALGRALGPRVMFDLADVDRVTSFGVREWLAMMAAAPSTERTLARCAEAVANQLTMIRKFDGGARIASLFAPYLCTGCGAALERLLDCERDAAELAALAPAPIRCPRCDGEARFDDDPRSYFGFAHASVGAALPADVRAAHDAALVQLAAAPPEDVDKSVDHDVTRIRVAGRLSTQIRWRKILDGIEGALVVDLSASPAADAAGVDALEQALRALPAEVQPIAIEHAPALRWVQLTNAGVNSAHGSALWNSAISITNASGIHAGHLAQYTLAVMLSHAHHLPLTQRLQARRAWPGAEKERQNWQVDHERYAP